jgi:O-antigen/teichoic acid export membrane protein
MSAEAPTIDRKSALRQPMRLLANVLSLRYFVLRASTAAAAVAFGLVQTFVFARVLDPDDFSLYILIGTLGISLWMFDLGASKILFVRQRARHLAGETDCAVPAQSTAVVMVYALLVLAGTLSCFAVTALRPKVTLFDATEFALFFSFAALNLVWYPLRNVSNAIDEFIHFETLEAIRRIGHIALMLTLLAGLPLAAFLVLANLLWFALLATAIARLVHKNALSPRLRGVRSSLVVFWRDNRREILRSGNYAVGELAVYNFPYLVVPFAFGLGAPTIILDTVFKVFRGATLIYAAGLDPLVPQQTRAFAAGDAATLKKATLTSAVLCAIPTLALCVVLLVAGDRLFAVLLDHAATIPHEATLILVVLLLANLAQNVASNLLLHTGFFREIARVASFLVVAMAAMTGIVLALRLDIVGFIGGYTVIYIAGAVLYIAYVLRGPFRIAAMPKG